MPDGRRGARRGSGRDVHQDVDRSPKNCHSCICRPDRADVALSTMPRGHVTGEKTKVVVGRCRLVSDPQHARLQHDRSLARPTSTDATWVDAGARRASKDGRRRRLAEDGWSIHPDVGSSPSFRFRRVHLQRESSGRRYRPTGFTKDPGDAVEIKPSDLLDASHLPFVPTASKTSSTTPVLERQDAR